jgi:putative FmdB family regulatory protein
VPIYDYVCEDCGHVMEVAHGIHAEGSTVCPECGGTLSKAFAPPAIHFRGSGWAKKDRKSVSGPVKKKSTEASTASEPAAGGAATGTGTTNDAAGGE